MTILVPPTLASLSFSLLQGTAPPVDAQSVLVPLAAALGLAVLVERVVEFLKNAAGLVRIDTARRELPRPADTTAPVQQLVRLAAAVEHHEQQEAPAEALRAEIDRLEKEIDEAQRQAQSASDDAARSAARAHVAELEAQLSNPRAQLAALKVDGAWDEQTSAATMLVEPATDPDDGDTLRVFVIQMIALAVGIVAAHAGHVRVFSALMPGHAIPSSLDYLLTGLLIGGGSAPVHILLAFISERKMPAPEPEAPEAASAISSTVSARTPLATTALPAAATGAATPAGVIGAQPPVAVLPAVATSTWVDIPYDGGVDRELLAGVHHRRARPDLVVFHHTAMHSRSTFEDVVRVIKSRTDSKGNHWLTGYHCVILADGSVHPFCRWDRYGNHAEGYNRLSLGVTFNGNFEIDPSVPYANPDGRYGIATPTEAQLDAGARVTALWLLVYGIPLDFRKKIIPHKWIATTKKTCPGGNFPYQDFEKLVTHYHQRWTQEAEAKDRLDAFRRKPYLFETTGAYAWPT